MSITTLTTGVLIFAVVIYMISNQFRERPIKPTTLIITPALITYYTYTNILAEFAKSVVDPTWLIGALVVGLLLGLGLGFFRGNLAHLRLDVASGKVYARASTLSLILWCLLLVLKIGAAYLTYSPLGKTVLPILLLISILHTLFLGNIVAEKVCLYLRANRYGLQQPMQVQKIKW
ncbi:hypothetical protein KSF_039910 [Reticulibacter mediterranei]|uniref:DUF1453 domain-containing protein n=1 Tax=Reticulibacter mediterranei TaxID=2778369 RepID=A0A8J3IK65_9CHLR|nr:hypothetical protein [Reticulibacter mediterranei]GHO93943.1 hypothetical protein KSF_039910 [Reticulibacter mediterranei]